MKIQGERVQCFSPVTAFPPYPGHIKPNSQQQEQIHTKTTEYQYLSYIKYVRHPSVLAI